MAVTKRTFRAETGVNHWQHVLRTMRNLPKAQQHRYLVARVEEAAPRESEEK